jgi:hypothetical protein
MLPWLVVSYCVAGLCFGVLYVSMRLPRPSGLGLRMILLPGALVLWPYLLYRQGRERQ